MTRFSSPVRCSSRAAYWPASAIRGRSAGASATTSRPTTRALPASGSSSVARMRAMVVLPGPLGPSTPSTGARAPRRSTPSSARVGPNDLTSPLTRMAGASPASVFGMRGRYGAFRPGSVLDVGDHRRVSDATTSSRLLTLLSLLQGRRDWPGGELAERLDVSGRTVRRDVERLRSLGSPVESMTGPTGGYQLRAGTAMPPLLLDDDEAIAIAVGLRTAAGGSISGIEETAVRALVKLEQVLPSHLRRRVQALTAATQTLNVYGGPTVDPQALTLLAAAVRDHERVRFAYTARDRAGTQREIEPHSLVNAGRRWYLVAYDCGREDWRTFRVDRIERPVSSGSRFHPRELPAKDAAAYVSRALQSYPSRHEARVTVESPAADLQGRRWLGGDLTPLGHDRCELRTSDDNLDWLAMRIAMLSAPYTVHGPPELIERLRAIAQRISAGT